MRLPISRVASLANSLFRSSRSWAAREIIFARSSIGRVAQDTKALSAVAKASIISRSVCSVKVLRASPVAGFTLRYGTMSSFSVRVTVDHHTASRGTGRQICRVMGSWIEIFQQMNSVIVAIHERLINYIFLLGESRNTDLANSLIEF